jgi:hypothetical protein
MRNGQEYQMQAVFFPGYIGSLTRLAQLGLLDESAVRTRDYAMDAKGIRVGKTRRNRRMPGAGQNGHGLVAPLRPAWRGAIIERPIEVWRISQLGTFP